MNKITNKEMFTIISAIIASTGIPEDVSTSVTPDEIQDWIQRKIESLGRRSETLSKKEREKVEADLVTMHIIEEVLAENPNGLAVSEIIKSNEDLSGLSSQKVSALMKKLIAKEVVTKEKVKDRMIYKINNGADNANSETDVQD